MRAALLDVEETFRATFSRSPDKQRLLSPTVDLSGRERDVLKYTADGRTAKETARLLYISTATVQFHIQSAINKLDAKNKTEAVVKAALWGMI